MNPTNFPESNIIFGPPENLHKNQVKQVPGYIGHINQGSLDGSTVTIVAWEPTEEERQEILKGNPIFLSCIGGLPPHFLTTSFEQANNPA